MVYVFDPEVLREIARKGFGLPREQMFDTVTEAVAARYPGVITRERDWFFNTAGGAMGVMTFLYASLWEYLIFFGTPIGNSGHSGRYHFVDDWFWIMDGEMWYAFDGRADRVVCRPGDEAHLPRGTVKYYRIVDKAWGLEYARGFIPSMLPFGLAHTVFTTLDYRGAFQTCRVYGKHVIRNLFRRPPPVDAATEERAS